MLILVKREPLKKPRNSVDWEVQWKAYQCRSVKIGAGGAQKISVKRWNGDVLNVGSHAREVYQTKGTLKSIDSQANLKWVIDGLCEEVNEDLYSLDIDDIELYISGSDEKNERISNDGRVSLEFRCGGYEVEFTSTTGYVRV